jgi:hypothetical protein
MRLALVSVWPQIAQGAGKSTEASESMALLRTTAEGASRETLREAALNWKTGKDTLLVSISTEANLIC